MYHLTDICFMCLKNNIKLQSVLIEDTDGIVVNEKLRCFFPEIIDSTPDAHKLACPECLEKLRISYDFKQSVICNNTVFRDYIDKLQCQHKIHQQLLVVLAHSKREVNFPPIRDITAKKVENSDEKLNRDSLMITNENINLTSTNEERLNKSDHSCQLTTNENVAFFPKFSCQPEEITLETENVEKVAAVTEIEEIFIKQEPFVDDNFTPTYLDEESMEFEGNKCGTETNSWDINSVEEECNSLHSNSNDFDKTIDASVTEQNVPAITKLYCEPDATTNLSNICKICQEMYKYLDNLLLHLNVHIQKSNCIMCKEAIENISKFQRRMLVPCGSKCKSHDKQMSEIYTKISCAVCQKEFFFHNLKTHLYTHIRNLTCVLCSKPFIGRHGKQNLHRHLLLHCDVKPYQCEICSKRFTVRESLKYHMNYIHSKVDKEYVTCQYCKKSLSMNSLRKHIVQQHENETFRCEVCKKVFIKSKNLEKHAKLHENQKNVTALLK